MRRKLDHRRLEIDSELVGILAPPIDDVDLVEHSRNRISELGNVLRERCDAVVGEIHTCGQLVDLGGELVELLLDGHHPCGESGLFGFSARVMDGDGGWWWWWWWCGGGGRDRVVRRQIEEISEQSGKKISRSVDVISRPSSDTRCDDPSLCSGTPARNKGLVVGEEPVVPFGREEEEQYRFRFSFIDVDPLSRGLLLGHMPTQVA